MGSDEVKKVKFQHHFRKARFLDFRVHQNENLSKLIENWCEDSKRDMLSFPHSVGRVQHR